MACGTQRLKVLLFVITWLHYFSSFVTGVGSCQASTSSETEATVWWYTGGREGVALVGGEAATWCCQLVGSDYGTCCSGYSVPSCSPCRGTRVGCSSASHCCKSRNVVSRSHIGFSKIRGQLFIQLAPFKNLFAQFIFTTGNNFLEKMSKIV